MMLQFETGGRTFLHDGDGWTDEYRETVAAVQEQKLSSAVTQLLDSTSVGNTDEEEEMQGIVRRMTRGLLCMCAELDPFHLVDPPSCREEVIIYLEGLGTALEAALTELAEGTETLVVVEDPLEADVVVLADRGWSEESIGRVLLERSDDLPMLLPVEALLPCLSLGLHPRDLPDECLIEFGRGHPAIEHLTAGGFQWPVPPQQGSRSHKLLEVDWPQESPLSRMGYSARKGGPSDDERRHILRRAFRTTVLPRVNSAEYMEEWGTAHSSIRLRKMVISISQFRTNHGSKEGHSEEPMAKWESDLLWLRAHLYDPNPQFQRDWSWPEDFSGTRE